MAKLRFKTLILVLCLCLISLVGCGPRGETKTLAEVLSLAKESFAQAVAHVSDAQVKAQVSEVSTNLEKILADSASANGNAGAAVSTSTVAIADKLGELVKVAGFPTRPAMGELATQFRVLSTDAGKGAVNPARVKLLAARTYSLLASELETTQFSVARM